MLGEASYSPGCRALCYHQWDTGLVTGCKEQSHSPGGWQGGSGARGTHSEGMWCSLQEMQQLFQLHEAARAGSS